MTRRGPNWMAAAKRHQGLATIVLLAGCGGGGSAGPTSDGPPDALPQDAGAADGIVDRAGGGGDAARDAGAQDAAADAMPQPPGRAVILTTGALGLIDVETLVSTTDVQAAPPNATARYTNGQLFVVDRTNDGITIREVDAGLSFVKTFSVGPGGASPAVPEDVCCTAADRCFVPRRQDPGLLLIDPQAAIEVEGEIDLSSLDADGNPNAYTCLAHAGQLFVGLSRWMGSGQTPQSPGGVAVIGIGAEALIDDFDTATLGPVTRFQKGAGATAWLGEAGLTGITDGALDEVDLGAHSAGATPVDETDLGANLYRFAVCDSGEAWMISIGLNPPGPSATSLRKVDLGSGTADTPLYSTSGPDLTWIAADSMDRIWVADRSAAPNTGIRIWNCDGTPLSPDPSPIDVGLHPPSGEGAITFVP
jgi:hypothetical protein